MTQPAPAPPPEQVPSQMATGNRVSKPLGVVADLEIPDLLMSIVEAVSQ